MALALRGFIVGAPKPNKLQIPSSNSYQQTAMTILQKQQHGLKHSRKISHSLIRCELIKTPPVGQGNGPKINETKPSQETNSNLMSSSNSERTVKKSGGETNATTQKTGAGSQTS